MAALFCSRPVTAAFRSYPRAVSPIIATASFSKPASQTWTAEETRRLMVMRDRSMTSKAIAEEMGRGDNVTSIKNVVPASQTWTAEETRRLMVMRDRSMTTKAIAEEMGRGDNVRWTAGGRKRLLERMRRNGSTFREIAERIKSTQVRRASTTTTPPTPTPSSTTPPSTPDGILTWDRFFKLRRTRRYINAGCSLFTAIATFLIAAPILAEQDFDTWGAQISGLDPIIVMGVSSFGLAAAGWLLGPTVGNGGFRIWAGRKGWTREIASKEKSFYARIKKYRADASSSSPQNPIPDYYGEKVASVKDYRRWLKDQRAFNLKKNKNMI